MSVDSEPEILDGPGGVARDCPDSRSRDSALVLAAVGLCLTLATVACSEAPAVDLRPSEGSRFNPRTQAQARVRVDELRDVLQRPAGWSEHSALSRFIARLVSRGDAEPHLTAIRELSSIALPSAAEAIAAALRDRASPRRVEAALALKEMRKIEVLPTLLETLDDQDSNLRGIVAGVIGYLVGEEDLHPDPDTVRSAESALARMLEEDDDPRVRLAALDALVMLGTEASAYSAFTIGSRDPDAFVVCGLVARTRFLVKGGRKARISVQMIRDFLRTKLSEEPRTRAPGIVRRAYYADEYYSPISKQQACVDVEDAAMSTLAILRDRGALADLLLAASNDVASRRASSAGALANYQDDDALAAVRQALVDPVRGVRQAAILGLGESHDPRADPLLILALQESAPVDRRDAAKALGGSLGASSALIRAFADPAVQVRNEAEAALLRSDEVVAKLEDALVTLRNESRPESNAGRLEGRRKRLEDGYARWMRERRESEIALLEGLGSSDARVRIRSARILAKFESPTSLELLLESLRNGMSPQSEMAALSLGLRGDPGARSALEVAARAEQTALSVAAIRALQDLGQSESLPLLRSVLETDPRMRVQTATGFAIAMLEMNLAAQERAQ